MFWTKKYKDIKKKAKLSLIQYDGQFLATYYVNFNINTTLHCD